MQLPEQNPANLQQTDLSAYQLQAAPPLDNANYYAADQISLDIQDEYQDRLRMAIRAKAKKDMIYGALWCVGGTVATIAQSGFIFWGAIVFGGVQFFRGLSNMNA